MGDGGGCHPRDNIALSWLSRELDLSYDWFDNIMMQREKQTDWLADLIEEQDISKESKIYILGKSFKPETSIETGSPAVFLKNILEERGHLVEMYDPYIDTDALLMQKGIYFIGTKHPDFISYNYPNGSIILDPWRYIPLKDKVLNEDYNIKVIHIGGNS